MQAKSSALSPAVAIALGSAAALVISLGHLTAAQAALVTSLATVIGTIAVIIAGVVEHKPVSIQAITGVAAALLADLVLFGFRLSPDARGAVAAAIGAFAGLALHLLHVTVTAAPAPLASVVPAGAAPDVLGPHRPSAVLTEDGPTEVVTRPVPRERF